MNRSGVGIRVIVVLVLVLLSLGLRQLILGGARPVSLKQDSLTSAVENSFVVSGANSYLPIDGLDYSINGINYFNNGWAVATLKPINNSSDPGRVVLRQVGGSYRALVGPSNFFDDKDYARLPADVVNFIKSASDQNAK